MFEINFSRIIKLLGRFANLGALIVAVVVLTGCSDGTTAAEYFEKSNEALQVGNLRSAVIHLKNALQKEPQMINARRALGKAYLILGFGIDAEKEFNRVIQSNLVTPEDINNRARALLQQRKYQEALDVLSKNDGSIDRIILKGHAARGLKDTKRAALYYDKALTEDPLAADAYKGSARLAWLDGDTGKMGRAISKAIESSPKDVEAWMLKGLLAAYEKHTALAIEAYNTALKVRRYDLSRHVLNTHSAAARLLLDMRQPDQAKPHIDAIGVINSRDPFYKYLDARFNYQKGNLDTAQAELREVLTSFPNHVRSLVLLGILERKQGNLGQAEEYLNRALSQEPKSLYTRQLLGQVYLALEQYQKTISTLKPVVRELPNETYTWVMLGTAYLKSGNLDGATRALSQAVTVNPESADVRSQLAMSYLATGRNETALEELQKAIKVEPDNARAGYLLAVTLLKKGDYQRVITEAEKLSSKQPGNAVPLNLIGAAYVGLGNPENARRMFTKASQLDPEYLTPIINIVKLDIKAGHLEEAKQGYERVLIKSPYNPVALLGLAKLMLVQGKSEKAIERLQQAHKNNPTDVESMLFLAELFRQHGRNAEALPLIEQALSQRPNDARGLLLQSRVLLELGRLGSARTSAEKLLKLAPKSAPAIQQMAVVHIRSGELKAGLAVLQTLLNLYPENPGAKLTLSNLELRMGALPKQGKVKQSVNGSKQADNFANFMIKIRGLLAKGKFDQALVIAKAAVEKSPQSPNALTILGSVYRAKGDFVAAKKSFEKILSLGRASDIAELNLASLARQENDFETAKAHYLNVIKRSPDHLEANIGLAKLSDDEQAQELLKRMRLAHPDALKPMLLLAQLHLNHNRWQEAINTANEGLKRAPTNALLLLVMGYALHFTGNSDNAEQVVGRLLKTEPNSVQALLLRGSIRKDLKLYDQGRQDLLKALKIQPDNLRVKMMLANLEIAAGKHEKAVALLREVLDKKPEISKAWSLLGEANWYLKNAKEAINAFIQADKLQHSSTNVIKLSKAYWLTDKKASAKKVLRQWISSQPADIEIHNTLGDMLMIDEQWLVASHEYESVLKISPQNSTAMNKLAAAYDKLGDARSESLLATAYKLNDSSPEILGAYGWLLVKKDKFQQAISILQKAVSLEKNVADAIDRASTRFHLAEAYRKNGNKSEARSEFKALLAMGVDFPEKDLAELTLIRLQ